MDAVAESGGEDCKTHLQRTIDAINQSDSASAPTILLDPNGPLMNCLLSTTEQVFPAPWLSDEKYIGYQHVLLAVEVLARRLHQHALHCYLKEIQGNSGMRLSALHA